MNHQSILFNRVDTLEFSRWCRPKLNTFVGKEPFAARRTAVSGNYLPGLRAVENDVKAHFENDFVWLGF